MKAAGIGRTPGVVAAGISFANVGLGRMMRVRVGETEKRGERIGFAMRTIVVGRRCSRRRCSRHRCVRDRMPAVPLLELPPLATGPERVAVVRGRAGRAESGRTRPLA